MRTSILVKINIDTNKIKRLSWFQKAGAAVSGILSPGLVERKVYNEIKKRLKEEGLTTELVSKG